jgi:uncharacterized membrane protein YjfL (UPF0719 family)
MDFQIVGLAVYETLLSVACGLLTIWIVIQSLQRSIGPKSPALAMKQGNTAVAVFYGAVVVCVLILVQPCITSSVNTLRIMASAKEGVTLPMIGVALVYFLAFYVIALVISLVVLGLTICLYMTGTRHVNEAREIQNNNWAVAILSALILLGITLVIRPSTDRLIQSLVSYERPIHTTPMDDGVAPQP